MHTESNVDRAGGRGRAWALALAVAVLLAVGLAGWFSTAVAAPGPTDLAVTKSDSADPVARGGSFTYTVQVANTGANDATGVIVTDVLPAQVDYVSANATLGSCSRSGKTVSCDLGTVNAGVTATVTIAVRAAKNGTASNTASVSTTVADANAANNQDTETTVIANKPKGPKAKPSCAAPTISGTPGPDVLTGTRGADAIRGFAGNDRIFGLGGKDLICADRGDDFVEAGDGNDLVIGGGGRDRLVGAEGGDTLKGKAGRDKLAGRSGNDLLAGGKGRDARGARSRVA